MRNYKGWLPECPRGKVPSSCVMLKHWILECNKVWVGVECEEPAPDILTVQSGTSQLPLLEHVSALSRLCHSSDGRTQPSRIARTDHRQPVQTKQTISRLYAACAICADLQLAQTNTIEQFVICSAACDHSRQLVTQHTVQDPPVQRK